MKIKNSIKLILSNMKTVFSDLLFRTVIALFFGVIGIIFLRPLISEILRSSAVAEFVSTLKALVLDFFVGGSSIAETATLLSSAWKDVLSMLTGYIIEITWVSLGLLVLFILHTFFNGMANYASGVAIEDYMSSLTRTGYFRAILKRFSKGFLYQLIVAILNIVWLTLTILLAGLFFTLTVNVLGVFALTVAVLVFVLSYSVKSAFLSNFLPSIVTGGNGIGKAMKESFTMGAKNFASLYLQYVLYAFFVAYVNLSFAVFTLGAGLIFTIPASCVFYSCVKLVNYYSSKNKKYYIDYENIVLPHGTQPEEEKFLDEIYL